MKLKFWPHAFVLCLSVVIVNGWAAAAHAQATPEEGTDPRPVIEKALGTATKVNLLSAKAFGLMKAAIKGDPFAVVDALIDLFLQDGTPPDITVLQARDEILAALTRTRGEAFVGRANGLLAIFSQLVADPRNMLADNRLALYLNDATTLQQELQVIMRTTDPARVEEVISLVPVYNMVVSSLVIGLTMANWDPASIETIFLEAIKTNEDLISDDDNYGGYVYNHVIGQYGSFTCNQAAPERGGQYECKVCEWSTQDGNWDCRPHTPLGETWETGPQVPFYCDWLPADCDLVSEERRRFDRDPNVYLIRRTVTDQMLAVL